MDLTVIWSAADKIGVIALFILIGVGGYRKWWRWGYQYDEALSDKDRQIEELKVDRDEWKELTLRGLSVTERSAAVAARYVLGPEQAEDAQKVVQRSSRK